MLMSKCPCLNEENVAKILLYRERYRKLFYLLEILQTNFTFFTFCSNREAKQRHFAAKI